MSELKHIQEARSRLKGREFGRRALAHASENETNQTLVISQGVFVDLLISDTEKTFYVVEPDLTTSDLAGKASELGLPEEITLLRVDSLLGQELLGKTVGAKYAGRNGKVVKVVRVYEQIK